MSQLVAQYSQTRIWKKLETSISFRHTEETNLNVDDKSLKIWASGILHHLYQLQCLQSKPLFNLLQPIEVEILLNNERLLFLRQQRVTKDTVVKGNENLFFPLKGSRYLLVPYRKKRRRDNLLIKKVEDFNSEKIFNTIEYKNIQRVKYGTPIIYTGMKD